MEISSLGEVAKNGVDSGTDADERSSSPRPRMRNVPTAKVARNPPAIATIGKSAGRPSNDEVGELSFGREILGRLGSETARSGLGGGGRGEGAGAVLCTKGSKETASETAFSSISNKITLEARLRCWRFDPENERYSAYVSIQGSSNADPLVGSTYH